MENTQLVPKALLLTQDDKRLEEFKKLAVANNTFENGQLMIESIASLSNQNIELSNVSRVFLDDIDNQESMQKLLKDSPLKDVETISFQNIINQYRVEFLIFSILHFLKKMPEMIESQIKHEWKQVQVRMLDLQQILLIADESKQTQEVVDSLQKGMNVQTIKRVTSLESIQQDELEQQQVVINFSKESVKQILQMQNQIILAHFGTNVIDSQLLDLESITGLITERKLIDKEIVHPKVLIKDLDFTQEQLFDFFLDYCEIQN